MAVLSGALLSGEAAKTRAKLARTRGEAARKISFKMPSPAFDLSRTTKTAMLRRLVFFFLTYAFKASLQTRLCYIQTYT